MPAVLHREPPSISQIYAAFDDACYGVFRRAMVRSRGGVVRVEDVLAALAEMLPDRTAVVLGLDAAAVARLARQPTAAPDRLPMSNESGLRSALAKAYEEAEGRSITPLLLLEVVARSRPETRRSRPEVVAPPSPSSVRHPARRPPPPTEESVQTVLRQWLEVQSWPVEARERALQQLASLAPIGYNGLNS